jgi:hypothetical protein
MKKALASVLAALSISAFAAWDRVASLQVADVAAQGEAAAKVGQMVGNPLAAASLAAALAGMPTVTFFGPAREKATMLVPFYLDMKAVAKNPQDAIDDMKVSVLYPVSISKEEFIKRHEGAVEKEGAVVVKGDLSGEDKDEEKTYVVFSKDGKWAGASDDPERAKLALADVKLAEKALKGEVVRLRVNPKAVKALAAAVKDVPGMTATNMEMINALKAFSLGLRVSDRGIDLNGSITFAEGTEYAKCGLKPLGADPLAFAGKGAFSATAEAEDCGNYGRMTDKKWADILALVKKHGGFDLSQFLARSKDGSAERYVFDIAAVIKTVTENPESFGKFDFEKFSADAEKLEETEKFTAKAPACANAGVIKGFESQWTVAERFAATVPEAAAKKPFYVTFGSISSVVKAIVPHLLALVPEEQRAAIKPVADTFAVETKTGIAAMMWRAKAEDPMRFMMRISADEIRGIGGIINAAMSMGALGGMGGGEDGDCGDEDGSDDGDDED